jgi:hypothetical protein
MVWGVTPSRPLGGNMMHGGESPARWAIFNLVQSTSLFID